MTRQLDPHPGQTVPPSGQPKAYNASAAMLVRFYPSPLKMIGTHCPQRCGVIFQGRLPKMNLVSIKPFRPCHFISKNLKYNRKEYSLLASN